MAEERKVQLGVEVDATSAKQGIGEIKRSLSDLGATASKAGNQAADGIGKIGDGVDQATKATMNWTQFVKANMGPMMRQFSAEGVSHAEAHTKAIRKIAEEWKVYKQTGQSANVAVTQAAQAASSAATQLGASQTRLLESIKRQSVTLTEGKSAWLGIRAAQLGVADAAAPYIAKIREAEKAHGSLGMTAHQAAFAMRSLPMQFTDIVTSLQAGQNPMQVFLQQGGQLKDLFGGIGPAAKAFGGYLVGLINPFTIAAGAAVALGIAYNQGSKEADAYSKALILTGNAAGTTADQLADMAARVSKSVGTQGAAAAALAELAGTGRIAASNLEEFSRVAVQMEKTVGQSVKQTAQDLAELGKSPVEASEKLNEKYRYLTAAVYEQIKALQDQGRTDEAAAAAQKAYADAFDGRTKQIKENLGAIESAFRDATGLAKTFWDAVLNVDRKDTNADMLKGVKESIAAAESRISRLSQPGAGLLNQVLINLEEKRIANLRVEQAELEKTIKLDADRAAAAAEALKVEEAGIAWKNEGEKYLSKRAQMEREVNKAVTEGVAAGKNAVEIVERIGKIREKYAEKSTGNNELANLKARVAAERQYLEQLKEHGSAADKLNEGEKLSLQYSKQLEGSIDAKTRKRVEELKAQADQLAATLKEQDALKDLANANDEAFKSRLKFNASLSEGLKKIEDDIKAQQLHNDQLGLSKDAIADVAAQRMDDQAAILDGLAIKAMDKNLDYEQYELYKAQAEKLRELAQLKREGGIKETMIEAGKKAAESWKRDFDRIGDWLGDALQRGFESGKGFLRSFADSVKSALLRLGTQWLTAPLAAFGASLMNPTSAQAATTGVTQGMNWLSAGQTLWQGFSTGFASFGGNIAQTVQSGMNFFSGSGGYIGQGPMELSGFAQGAGAAAGYLAGGAAGVYGGRAISNGYAISGSGNSLVNAGTAIGAIFGGPLGAAIGGMIAGAVNRAFGTKVVGSGLMGSVSGDQFTGNGYQFSRGGFLRGGGSTSTSDLDGATTKAFASAISTVYQSFSSLGEAIGAGGNLLEDYNYSFRLALGDFSDEDKPRIIQNQLKRMTDSMAAAFVDNFRTSIDAASQQANTYYTNTIDGEAARPTGASGIITQTRAASQLEPFIDDIIRIFDAKRAELGSNEETLGQLATFTTALFSLGDALVENAGYARLFGEALDFDKLESAASEGESVLDTFTRLNNVFVATNSVATTLGKEVDSAFGAIGVASTAARERLITLTGGIESLTSGTAFFASNFLSEAEQIAPVMASVAERMADLGYASVDTVQEFADLATGLDLGTEAGASLYAQLIAIAPAFKQVADYTESLSAGLRALQSESANLQVELLRAQGDTTGADAAQRLIDIAGMTEAEVAVYDYNQSIRAQIQTLNDASSAATRVAEERVGLETQLLQLQGNTAELRRRELDALDPTNRALQQRIYDIQDAQSTYERAMRGAELAFSSVQRAVDAERKSITTAYNERVTDFNARIKDITGSIGKLTSLSNALKSTLDRMRIPSGTGMDRAAAQAQIQAAVAIARAGGPLPTTESIAKALQVLSEPNEAMFTSFSDYKREVAMQSSLIGELADLTDGQISIDESTLSVLNEQLNTEKAWYEGEMDRLDTIIAAAQESMDTLKGIPTGIMSIADAVASLRGAVNVAASAQASVATLNNTQSDIIRGLYQNILGRDPRAEGAAFWQQALVSNPKYRTGESSIFADFIEGAVNTGGTDAERARAWARANNIPGFSVGTNRVPSDMLALVHEDERIIPAADNRALIAALRNPGARSAELVAEIRALRSEVAQFRQANSQENYSIALHASNTADILDASANGGRTLSVEVAT